jgi:hydrogenase maturation protease
LEKGTLVLGIGNLLLNDEAAGIHVVRLLEEEGFSEADLIDGGTGGYHLLGLIQDYRYVIITDASIDDMPEGHVRVLNPKFAKDFPRQLSAHEIGLKDLIEAAFMLGSVPEIFLVTVSVKNFQEIGMELSPQVAAAIPFAAAKVRELVKGLKD